MFCTYCGTQNEDNASFCTKCGAGLTAAAQAARQSQGWPLTITRETQFTGSLVGMTVALDGRDCGKLSPGQTLTYTASGQIVEVSLTLWSTPPVKARLRLGPGAHITCGIKLGAFINKVAIKNVVGAEVLE